MLNFLPHLPFDSGITPAVGWLLAAAAVLITGIAKSGFGGGVGIVAVPLMALAFGAKSGNAILLPILIAADTFSVYHHWGTWHKPTLKILAPGTLAGIALGSLILFLLVFGIPRWMGGTGAGPAASATSGPATITADPPLSAKPAVPVKTVAQQRSEDALNLITGVVSVLYVILDQVRRRYAPKWHFKPTPATSFAAGSAVGVVSTLAHSAGPVAAIFLLNQDLVKQAFIGTTVIYFFCINTIKLIPYISMDLIGWDTVKTGLWLSPLVPLGNAIGAWM
ncbi:MAG: sulfite exporter TauE/SafE family protein, partial [Phycisphaerae bacterium]